MATKATVHIVIHRCGQDDRSVSWSLVATARDLRAGDNLCRSSSQLVDPPSLLRCRPPLQSETALAEANSFPSGCQQFRCIRTGCFAVGIGYRKRLRALGLSALTVYVTCSGGSVELDRVSARFDPANAGQYPQTVARKSAIRLRPKMMCFRGPRRPAVRPFPTDVLAKHEQGGTRPGH
jgi:hypothetical protein